MSQKQGLAHALAACLFAAIAISYFGRGLRLHFADSMISAGPDASSFVWYLGWWPHAVAAARNPLVSYEIFAPSGANLAWTTSISGLALIAAPITNVFGPVVSYNTLALAAPAASAFTAYLLAYHITAKFWPAVMAGYLFGFSSYELGQMAGGHLNLATVFLLPLGILLYLRRRVGAIERRPFIAAFTGVMVLEFAISTEIFAAAVLFAAAILIAAMLVDRVDFRERDAPVIVETFISSLIAGAILSPFLYYVLTGYRGALHSPMDWPTHPFNYFIPTPVTGLGGAFFARVTSHFPGAVSERGAYLGIPLLVIVGLFIKEFWVRKDGKILILSSAIVFVAALGPVLHVWEPPAASATPPGYVSIPGPWRIHGRPFPVPLPWFPFSHLPFFNNLLPLRFSLFMWICVAVIAAVWLAETRRSWWVKVLMAGLAVVFLLPNASHRYVKAIDTPAFFKDGLYKAYVAKGENVIIFPYEYEGNSMLWQAQTGWYFRMAGGYVGAPPKGFSPLERFYLGFNSVHPRVPPGCRDELISFITAHDVGAIIVKDSAMPVFRPYLGGLGIAAQEVGGVWIYQIPSDLRADATAKISPSPCE